MRNTSRNSSGADRIICPRCEIGHLEARSMELAGCTSCDSVVELGVLHALRWIVALPDSRGGHACECGHPEMRRLPDGVFWCPSCGSEVLPVVQDHAASDHAASDHAGPDHASPDPGT